MTGKKRHVQAKKRFPFLLLLTGFFLVGNLILFGIWYHLHFQKKLPMNPSHYPEITELAEKQRNFQELSVFFTKLANTKGAEYAYQVLRIAPMPPNIDMHLLGHVVGDILYKQEGINGIKVCTDDFRNACSHSIVIALFLKNGTKAIQQIAAVCRQAPGGKGAYTMCFHGLGHGVLAYVGYDMEKAITLCHKTGTQEYQNNEYRQCVGGVTMEMISGVHDHEAWQKMAKKYFKDNDPLYPCDSDFMPDDTRFFCYVYITPHLFQTAGSDLGAPTADVFQKAFPDCNAVSPDHKLDRDACYGGFGKEFVVLAQNRDIRKIDQMNSEQLTTVINWCTLADADDGRQACIVHAMQSIYWGGENNRTASIRFCSLVRNQTDQQDCFNELTSAVDYYIADDLYKKSYCSELPSDYQQQCKERLHV